MPCIPLIYLLFNLKEMKYFVNTCFLGILFMRQKPSLTIGPKFWKNHWKTIDVHDQSVKETFNGDSPVAVEPLKKITIPSSRENY